MEADWQHTLESSLARRLDAKPDAILMTDLLGVGRSLWELV
jgi:hypothetical protein